MTWRWTCEPTQTTRENTNNTLIELSEYLCAVYRWVEEFVGNPNHGHVALIDLIKDLADHPNSVPRKNAKKYTVLNRDPVSRASIL